MGARQPAVALGAGQRGDVEVAGGMVEDHAIDTVGPSQALSKADWISPASAEENSSEECVPSFVAASV
jgi:hypothetical protein